MILVITYSFSAKDWMFIGRFAKGTTKGGSNKHTNMPMPFLVLPFVVPFAFCSTWIPHIMGRNTCMSYGCMYKIQIHEPVGGVQ